MEKDKQIIASLIKKNYLKIIPSLKKEKTQQYSTLVLTLLAFSIFAIFAINPTISTIAELKKELADNKVVDEKLQDKIKNLGILQNKFMELKEDLFAVDAAMPKNPQAPLLTGQIQSLAKENNITIDRLQIFEVEMARTGEAPKTNYFAFSFLFDGEGSYKNISTFISSLVSFDRIVNLDTVSVTKTGEVRSDLYRLSLRGTAYFKK